MQPEHHPRSAVEPLRVITLCFSSTLGGLELATLRRGAELQAHGHHVTAVLPDAPGLIEYADQLGLSVDVITPALPYLDLRAAAQLRRVIRRQRATVLLVGRTRDLSTAMVAARSDVAVVLYQQMQAGLNKRDFFHDRIFRRLDGCVAITYHARTLLTGSTAIDPAKVSVIPYGIDTTRFSPDAISRKQARRELNVADDAFVVGIIGGFNPAKGQREFITAMGMAAEMAPELARTLQAVLIGQRSADSSEYIEELHHLRDNLPIADRITFHPFQPDPRTGYAALDLFVLASYAETFGMVVQESLAMGVPTVATASAGVQEIITDGETGVLIPPRDAEAIASAVVRLYRDPALRSRYAEQGRAFVCREFNSEQQYSAFEHALYEALWRRRKSTP